MKVVVTGATGFVGQRLIERLQEEGHQVLALVRSPDKAAKLFPSQKFSNVNIQGYEPQASGDWQKSLSGWDGVVNLAGEPLVGDRWTTSRKQEIINSRAVGTQKLVEAIAAADDQPSVLVNASAIGFYGTSETATFDESSNPGDDFLAEVCQSWEKSAQSATDAGTRLVIFRIGIVLGDGGALAKMLPPFQMFAGGPIGSGKQWFSWVHLDDLVNFILTALTDTSKSGVYNATAPNPVRMNGLCESLGKVLNRPSWLPVPDIALELLLGEAAQLVLEGQNVRPEKTQADGFQYKYETIDSALKQILT
ncbi:TIGR01777 family oxidoreductase [Acaryochloris sp. CCMEE 5410]|uniref:thylakoid membrane protein ThyD n=1 Tax=Acaryochloris sp. CCMEE 5410 TaxID=310037 RepID=UPI0002484CAF|nr:TIGR01777 family oxidoreductase [Acaryochloris sp. CCMEE 5410]KAI9132768.1 TIGR01777 family protein [Acaryochloris sp. CCMEE 5410]